MTTTKENPMFTVKNLRTTATGAYSASLYEGGKRVAVVSDEGRGGAPRVEPVKAENYGKEMRRIEKALADFSHTLPAWYLTSHGAHPALDLGDGNWELAIGFLVECLENDKAVKPGRALYLRPDGVMVTAAARASGEISPDAVRRGYKLWKNGDWVAA